MTSSRCCLDCGTPEVRTEHGTNLEPISGLCLACLSKPARRERDARRYGHDPKMAQAGKDE